MPNGDAEKQVQPLDYAPADKRPARRMIRRVVFWSMVIAAGIVGFRNRSEISLRARRAYWLYQCEHHVTPPGTVLEETDPVKAAHLLATNPDYVTDSGFALFKGWPVPTTTPASSGGAVYDPRDFREYAAAAGHWDSGNLMFPDAIAFMGIRVSPGGHRRLVIITLVIITSASFDRHNFNYVAQYCIVEPTAFLGSGIPMWLEESSWRYGGSFVDVGLKPGVADPRDLSHLTVDYFDRSVPSIHGTFDMYLQDDDSLKVTATDAPRTKG